MPPITPYTDADLEALLSDLESDRIERKESFSGDVPTKAREAVCAFANDLPDHRRAGVLFIGARDDGSPSRTPITDEMLLALSDMKADGNLLPPPTLFVHKRRLLGADMAVVIVEPSDAPPVRYRGRVWVRVGPRRGIATAQDERLLNEKRRHRDRWFDVRPISSATIADLDRRRFESEYLPSAVAPDVLAANERTYEERLASTKMIVSLDEPVPTLVGLLVLGTRTRDFVPGAYIQFLRISGTSIEGPIIDEGVVDGAISDMLRRIDEKLVSHNRTAVDLTASTTEVRRPTYPIAALQQLVRNAVMHRTYEATSAPVRVTWLDDRIEITSPGGPYGIVTRETFGRPGVADYRNPNLAEALRALGFVQRYGAGIPTARRELAANGNPPPEFHVEPTVVGVTVRRAP